MESVKHRTSAAAPSGRVSAPLVRLRDISKSYGSTRANWGLNFDLPRGAIVGLVGANGAGKSTLVRILCGVETPDSGAIEFDGERLDPGSFDPRRAGRRGIRIVHQELSLCANLSVLENFYLEEPDGARGVRWRRTLATRATEAIEAVFPGANISPWVKVANLSLAQRQMVEIAKAACDSNLKLLILDEPTSSLDSVRSADLLQYMREKAASGVTFVFITHKLREIISTASAILVMRNGALVWQGRGDETSMDHLVELMGGRPMAAGAATESSQGPRASTAAARRRSPTQDARRLVSITAENPVNGLGRPISVFAGEIVGLAGLEGAGQREFLKRVQLFNKRTTAFVAGDRQKEGVFPEATTQFNAIIGYVARRGLWSYTTPEREKERAREGLSALRLPPGRLSSPILELSGGNQQKALMARALLTGSPLVLLDDPTRGVDVGVKEELYSIIRAETETGSAFLWCSTEDAELLQCDRVIVFREGRAVVELTGDELTEAAIVAASFGPSGGGSKRAPSVGGRWSALDFLAPATLAVILVVLGILNPDVFSQFGFALLLDAAVPVVLASLAQMFIVSGAEIDLGVGAFVGMTSVIAATALVAAPLLGALGLVLAVIGYMALALIIELRGVPAIVASLGASFVWLGIGHTLQLTPGGSSPEWLTAVFSATIPYLPAPLLIIALGAAVAAVINASKLGVVLRAMGNNRRAVVQLGWPVLWLQMARYALSSLFGIWAGLSLTAVNTASDVNAGSSFTLMSIASVVIGGSTLRGGWTRPLGVACGAVTLSLIGSVLGLLNVSTDFNPALQGALLAVILVLGSVLRKADP